MVLTPLLASSLLAEPFHSSDAVGGAFIFLGLGLLMRAKVLEAREAPPAAAGGSMAPVADAAASAAPALHAADVEAVPSSEWDAAPVAAAPAEAAEEGKGPASGS